MAKTTPPRPKKLKSQSEKRNSRATVGGPSRPTSSTSTSSPDDLAAKVAGTQALASRFPFNTNKRLEYDPAAATAPEAGQSEITRDARVTSSTVTEKAASEKVGSGAPTIGSNRTIGPLDRVRADSTDRPLTTNQGVPVGDNQSSLHSKPILAIGAAARVLEKAGIPKALPSGKPDSGLRIRQPGDGVSTARAFIAALAKHRHFDRETDPPLV